MYQKALLYLRLGGEEVAHVLSHLVFFLFFLKGGKVDNKYCTSIYIINYQQRDFVCMGCFVSMVRYLAGMGGVCSSVGGLV